jgi:hypothetical protein
MQHGIRKVSDLSLGPVFFYFLVLSSSLGIKADSAALYVIKHRGWAPSLRLITMVYNSTEIGMNINSELRYKQSFLVLFAL